MGDDPELEAMAAISKSLASLDEPTVARVLRWAADRYGVSLAAPKKPASAGGGNGSTPREEDEAGEPEEHDRGQAATFREVADLYDAASPKTDADKALVLAYWHQVVQDRSDFGSQIVNTSLKHLGHGISNITAAMSQLINHKPRLVMQTHKAGKTAQARKKYKLTREGVLAVERMTGAQAERE